MRCFPDLMGRGVMLEQTPAQLLQTVFQTAEMLLIAQEDIADVRDTVCDIAAFTMDDVGQTDPEMAADLAMDLIAAAHDVTRFIPTHNLCQLTPVYTPKTPHQFHVVVTLKA